MAATSASERGANDKGAEQADGTDSAVDARSPESLAVRYRAVWPLATSIALAHAGAVACLGDGCGSAVDTPLPATLPIVFACLLLSAAALQRARRPFDDALVRTLFYGSVAGECAAIAIAGMLVSFAPTAVIALTAAQAVAMLCAMAAITCALRRARTTSMATATALVFSAALLSKALCFAVGLLPVEARCAAGAMLVLGQFASARITYRQDALPRAQTGNSGYFAYLAHLAAKGPARRFLIACAAGLGGIATVSGLLQEFSPATAATPLEARAAELALTAALCAAFARSAASKRARLSMTVGIWTAMGLVAATALVLHAAFPAQPQVGAVASAALNVLAMTYVWHLVLAFMSSGWRSPFFYASVVWGIWTGSHLLGSVAANVLAAWGGAQLTGAVTGLVLLVSTQIILAKIAEAARFTADGRDAEKRPEESAGESPATQAMQASAGDAQANGATIGDEASPSASTTPNALERLLGLDEEAPLADVRYAAMRHHAEAMGQRFLLSEREIDVLTLYAMGFTQKRVAEELHVSPTTAHTHITRIYAKTALHSRQELLDFMRTYLDS